MDESQKNLFWTFFIVHALLYVATNLFFLILSLSTWSFWFIFPLFFWGLIVVGHFYLTKLVIQGYFTELKEKLLTKLKTL